MRDHVISVDRRHRPGTLSDDAKKPSTALRLLLVLIVLLLLSPTAGDGPAIAGCIDNDEDGFCNDVDCDDDNADVYPGAPELCDGLNNDCDHPAWPALDIFEDEQLISTSTGQAKAVFAADLDGDSDLDVLSASDWDNKIAWYENTAGDGSAWVEHLISAAVYGPISVYAADIDGDQDLDVLSGSSYYTAKVMWYENTVGDGSEWIAQEISSAANSDRTVFAADIDGDRDIDVLATSSSYIPLAWFENTAGNGSEWTEHLISADAYGASSVFAADIDGDHDVDVLLTEAGDDEVLWYENTSADGSRWREHTISTVADGARSVFALDVDGDLDVDVLSASVVDDKIAWYENRDGGGREWIEHAISTTANGAVSVFAADLDGDLDPDVLSASSGDDKIAWYENTNGDGSAWNEQVISITADGARSVFAADLDGDFDLDVLSASSGDDKIAAYRNHSPERDNDGDGLAECEGDCDDSVPACTFDCTDADQDNLAACADDCDETNPNCTTDCTDLDEDGFCVTTDCDDSNVDIYPGAPQICDGLNNDCDHSGWPMLITGWEQTTISSSADGAWSVLAADLDGDLDMDALTTSLEGDKIAWYDNMEGDGSVWAEHTIFVMDDSPRAIDAGDLDGDLDVDVLSAAWGDDKVTWFENVAGDGSVWNERVISMAVYRANSVAAADIDGDLELDVVASAYEVDEIAWYDNSVGDGSVWIKREISNSVGAVRQVRPADIDGDGDMDVVSASTNVNVVAWHENLGGDGLSWASHVVATPYTPKSVFAADIDGDLDLDIVVAHDWDGLVSWYENIAGDGTVWMGHAIYTWHDYISYVFAADLDGDLDIDVISVSPSANGILWHVNLTGDGTSWSRRLVDVTTGAQSVFAADVDGDLEMDILSASRYADEILLHRTTSAVEGDQDEDGVGECDGDCDDADPTVYPGATEVNDGLDNQCPGDHGFGLVDEISGICGFHDPSVPDAFSWTAQPGATGYEVARSEGPRFVAECLVSGTEESHWADQGPQTPGACFHYLVRSTRPLPGSWGADSRGVERTQVCP